MFSKKFSFFAIALAMNAFFTTFIPVIGHAGELVDLKQEFTSFDTYVLDANTKCTHRFTGLFSSGDASKIIAARPPLLCLDSPGGSLIEALQLTQSMELNPIATKIEEGARCESACALVFMAGAFHPDESEKSVSRHLHPLGKLGFHAPDLQIPDGNYNKQTVKKAYEVALQSMSVIIRDLVQRKGGVGSAMKPSLLGKMLDTPATSMFYVTTVDDAGRWDIQVGPLRGVERPTKKKLIRACINAYQWRVDETARFANTNLTWFDDPARKKGVVKGQVLISEMLETGCNFELNKNALNPISMKFDDGQQYYPATITYHDPNLRLTDLFKGRKTPRPDEVPNGFCYLDRRQPNARNDSSRCIHRTSRTGAKKIDTYEWPSGKTTTTLSENGRLYIDGALSKNSHSSPSQGDCTENPKDNTVFCYRKAP